MTDSDIAVLDDLLTAAQAAQELGVTERSLKRWRQEDRGPAWKHVPGLGVFYSKQSLLIWKQHHQRLATMRYRFHLDGITRAR